MKSKVILLFCLILLIGCKTVDYDNIEAFTHPLTLEPIPIYSHPGKYLRNIDSDVEAGWIVRITKKRGEYFQVNIEDLSLHNIWIKSGDMGLVIQNYDSLQIPMYLKPDTNASVERFILESHIGLLYDIRNNFALLRIMVNGEEVEGWIELKYLCGNPYTTCS